MNPSISYTKTLPYQNQFHHHVPLFQPSNIPVYQNIPTNITYFHPTYFCVPYTCKQYLVYELVNPGHIPVVAHPFVPNLQSTSSSKSKVKIEETGGRQGGQGRQGRNCNPKSQIHNFPNLQSLTPNL